MSHSPASDKMTMQTGMYAVQKTAKNMSRHLSMSVDASIERRCRRSNLELAAADPYLAERPTLQPRTNFPLGGRHRAGRIVEPSRGLESEVLAQAALFTIAGGAGSPAVTAAGRTVGGGGGLSEGRAGKQRDQRESSDKRFHDASPCYGRLS